MQFQSTRNPPHRVGLSEAIARGLAPDGGLYVPTELPGIERKAFDGVHAIAAVAEVLLRPFAAGDAIAAHVPAIVRDAFNFPVPVVEVAGAAGPLSVLELFHGPTAAFKDFGARFLAASLERIPRTDPRRLTILVATSGDTGGAVAAAFYQRPWVDVVVLYPQGLVSARQEKQLACWGRNVRTLAVAGTFDDCQRMVKEAFVDPALGRDLLLSSANSINVGRLLPQMAYYAQSSLELFRRDGRAPNYIVPSGNLGNVAACLWARKVGLPIGEVMLATNANLTVPDFLRTGEWQPRPSLATLASAMDVGNPSNMERLRWLFPDLHDLRGEFSAYSVSDDEIRASIKRDYAEYGQTWCPHTATAAHLYRQLPAERRKERWVLVGTAHPAKFNDVVEPLIGAEVPVPAALADLLSLPSLQQEVAPRLEDLRNVLKGESGLKTFLGLPLWLWVIFALGLIGAAGYFIREKVRQVRARRAIDNVISSVAFDELRNVLLPTGTGDQIHINYLLLTQNGLLALDLFDAHGMVFAGEKMEQWSIFGPKRHFMITNPLPMLYDRVAVVRQFAGDDVPVEGRIVFSMRGEFPKGRPESVIRLDELQDQFPAVERAAGGAAAAFAGVWERIKQAAQPNPLAS